MKLKFIIPLVIVSFLSSCSSIPKETVELSKVLGNDIKILQNSHKTTVKLFYDKVIENINAFIDDIYSPFIIHYALKDQLQKYKKKEESIYGVIESAGINGEETETDNALNIMIEFLEDAYTQVEKKRIELLNPIINEKNKILTNINDSYENTIYANSTITGYLESIRKVKESQQETLSIIGLKGKDEELNNVLLQASKLTKLALAKGKEIDIKSDEAYLKIEEVSNQIKSITNKK